MYDIVSYQIINLCIKEVKNEEIKKGIENCIRNYAKFFLL